MFNASSQEPSARIPSRVPVQQSADVHQEPPAIVHATGPPRRLTGSPNVGALLIGSLAYAAARAYCEALV